MRVSLLILVLTPALVSSVIFRNEKQEYFYFNNVELNYADAESVCASMGGVLPNLKSNDRSFAISLAALTRKPVWIAARKHAGSREYVDDAGLPVKLDSPIDDCASGECALVLSQKLESRDTKRRSLQVCQFAGDALVKVQRQLNGVQLTIESLDRKAQSLEDEQSALKQENREIEEKVEQVAQQLKDSTSGGAVSDSPIDIMNLRTTLQRLHDAQTGIVKDNDKAKRDTADLLEWKKSVDQQVDVLSESLDQLPSLKSQSSDLADRVTHVEQNAVPFLSNKVGILDTTLKSLAEDVSRTHGEHEKALDDVRSKIDALKLDGGPAGGSDKNLEAMEAVVNELRSEMREDQVKAGDQLKSIRDDQTQLRTQSDDLKKSVQDVQNKIRLMLTEWKSVLDRILQPSSAARITYMQRLRHLLP